MTPPAAATGEQGEEGADGGGALFPSPFFGRMMLRNRACARNEMTLVSSRASLFSAVLPGGAWRCTRCLK